MIDRRTFTFGTTLALAGGALAAPRPGLAGPVTTDEIGDRVQTLPKGGLPDFAELRSPNVRLAYRYAIEHGEALSYIPCFCGCGRFGHRSNRDCYVKAVSADGSITFTSHAAT